jgi:hypothetical protein
MHENRLLDGRLMIARKEKPRDAGDLQQRAEPAYRMARSPSFWTPNCTIRTCVAKQPVGLLQRNSVRSH